MTACLADGGAGAPGTARRERHVKAPLRTLCRLFISLSVVLACASVACVSSAPAAQPAHSSYVNPVPVVSYGDGDPSLLSGPTRLAFDQARKTLLVTDTGHNRVAVYTTGPGTTTFQQEVGVGTLAAPFGLAYDAARHFLYVSDAGNNRIVRYIVGGTTTATYTLDAGYTSPALGSGPGQIGSFAASLAVDSRNGDLLVADPGNHRVTRFTTSGNSSFNGADTPAGAFVSPTDVAVAADGTIYVTDVNGDPVFGSSRLEKFTPTGTSLGRIDTAAASNPAASVLPVTVTVNPLDGMVLSAVSDPSTGYAALAGTFGPDPAGLATLGVDFFGTPFGLAVDAAPLGQAYLLEYPPNAPSAGVWAFSAILAPGVSIDAPGSATATGVTLSGSVDTGGDASTTAHFEYSSDGVSFTVAPDVTPAPSSGTVATLTGLTPNQRYTARLVSTNAGGATTTSRLVSFTTETSPPGVVTLVARDVGTASATLAGTVTPFGLQTTYHFEYGLTDQYGATLPTGHDETAGAQRPPRLVSIGAGGLQPNTLYHYRLVATNASGTSYGQDQTLVTGVLGEPTRGYEQVTPVQKDGAILNEQDGFRASTDGNAAMFQTLGTIVSTQPQSDPIGARTISRRTTTGWVARAVDPPYSVVSGTAHTYASIAFSPDLSQAIVASNQALTPGAVAGHANVYIETTATRALRLLKIESPQEFDNIGYGFGNPFQAGTNDWSHLFVAVAQPLTSDAPSSGGVYDVGGTSPVLVSRDALGAPATGVEAFRTSADGSTIAYTTSDGALAVVRNGVFRYISVSQRAGDPSTPEPVNVSSVSMSRDGTEMFFTDTGGNPLTTDAPAGPGDIYRWSVGAPAGSRLEYVGNTPTNLTLGASADGNAVFYMGAGGFVGWRSGVGNQLLSTSYSGTQGRLQPSPDGRYLALAVDEQLTADPIENSGTCGPTPENPARDGHCIEVYVFDLDAHSVTCASCAPDAAPAGDALVGLSTGDRAVASFLTPDGQVFFSTPTVLERGDVNGDLDVYAYEAGHTRLVSRGRAQTRSLFAGATASGSDVFFQSNDSLVSQDTDAAADLYDARVGGGIAAQNPAPPIVPCVGDECREPPSSAATLAPPASQTGLAPSPPLTAPARAKVSILRATVSTKGLRLSLRTTGGGRLRLSGHYLSTQIKDLGQGGTYSATVPLTRAARRLHGRHRQLTVGVRVSLAPPFGAAAVTTASRILHR